MTAATIDADLPPELEGAVAQRLERARAERRRRAASAPTTGRCGRPRARPRSPTGSAGWTSPTAWPSTLDDLEAFVDRGPRRGLHRRRRCSAWAARASRPRCSGRRFGPRDGLLRLHVLDSTDPRQIQAVHRRASTSSTTLFIVSSKSGGTIETMSQFKLFHALPARRLALRRGHRPGHRARGARARARLPARVRRRPGDRRALLGAVALRARPGRAGRRRRRAPCSRGAARPLRPTEGNAGLWLGCALGELARPGATSSRSSSTTRCARSACGPSSSSPSRPASRAAGILPIADEPLVDAGAYGADRVFVAHRRRRRRRGAAPRCATPAIR